LKAIFLHDYAGHPFQLQLSRELARLDFRVTHAYAGGLLTPRGFLKKKADDSSFLEIKEIEMHPNYRKSKYNFLMRKWYETAYGNSLALHLSALQQEAVISANTPSDAQWRLAKTCYRLGIPFISWVQDVYSEAVTRLAGKKIPILGGLIGQYYRMLDRKALGLSSAIISITEGFKETLVRLGADPKRIFVIPNWAPLDELPQRPKKNSWSMKHSLNDQFVFLYSGTLAMKHNPDLIILLARQYAGNPGVKIVVISEGPGATYLQKVKQAEGLHNLILLPFQDFLLMPDVLGSADVLLSILDREAGIFSVPSKVLTYQCAGRAILAAIPLENQAAQYITKHQSGICVEPEDTKGWLESASALLASSEKRNSFGTSCRVFAEKTFDIKTITDRFTEVIRFAMKNPVL